MKKVLNLFIVCVIATASLMGCKTDNPASPESQQPATLQHSLSVNENTQVSVIINHSFPTTGLEGVWVIAHFSNGTTASTTSSTDGDGHASFSGVISGVTSYSIQAPGNNIPWSIVGVSDPGSQEGSPTGIVTLLVQTTNPN